MMHKTRVYVDTSVFGGIEDDEFAEPSRRFFGYAYQGHYEIYSPLEMGEESNEEEL